MALTDNPQALRRLADNLIERASLEPDKSPEQRRLAGLAKAALDQINSLKAMDESRSEANTLLGSLRGLLTRKD